MSKLTTAIHQVLSDGEWHTSKEVIDRVCSKEHATRSNVSLALHGLVSRNQIKRLRLGPTDHDNQYRQGRTIVRFGISQDIATFNWLLAGVRGANAAN